MLHLLPCSIATLAGLTLALILALLRARWQSRRLRERNSQLAARVEEMHSVSADLRLTNAELVSARTEAERLAARTNRLQTVATALTAAATPAEVAEIVLGLGLGVVEAARGFLAIVDENAFEMIDAQGYAPAARERVLQVTMDSDIPLTRAIKIRAPVYLESVDDYQRDYPWAYGRFGAVSDSQAHVALPLIFEERVVGALGYSFVGPTAFGATDRAFTLLLGQMTAAALHRAREFAAERAQRRHAEAMSQAREEVLAVVAHDLRNPLNLINGTAQLILELDPDREKRHQLLGACVRAVRQMNRLIGDLLDVTRLQAGRFSLELERADLRALVQQLDETFRPQAAARKIAFSTAVPDDDVVLVVDSSRLLQALGNLVGNALKFTPEQGSVALSAELGHSGSGGVRFLVEDSGPGIPPDDLTHLFDRFWQARTDRRGIGLGLAIVKAIADAHGGRIDVCSVVGRGTTFAFSLPCAERGASQQQVA